MRPLAPLKRLLAVAGRMAGRRPGTVLLAALALTAGAAWPAARTLRDIDYNLVEVLTAGLPRAETYKSIARNFGIIDRHFLVVEIRDESDLPAARELADRLAAAMAADPGRRGRLTAALNEDARLAGQLDAAIAADEHLAGRLALVLGNPDELPGRLAVALPGDADLAGRLATALGSDRSRIGALAGALPMVRSARARFDVGRFLLEHAQLYLDEETAAMLSARFSDEGLKQAMERDLKLLEAGTPRQRVESDPLDLVSLLPEIARRRGGGSGLDPDGYMVSGDRRMVLVDVLPTQSAGDRLFARRLMRHSREVVRDETAAFFRGERAALAGRIEVETGGAYAAMVQHGSLMMNGIIRSAACSLLVVLVVFALVYRRASSLLFVGLPLLAPVIWTLAAAPLFLGGRLSILGAAFAAVLLGLGIDFAVHLYNRYASERSAGRTPAEAAETSVTSTGEGVVVGALTTVVAFAGMTLTSFRGLTEFGTMAALGVFMTMAALLVTVPAALVLLARWRERDRAPRRPASFGLELAARAVRARPGTFVALGFALFAAGVVAAAANPGRRGLGFETDFARLGPPREVDTTGMLNSRVAAAFGQADREVSIVVRGATAREAIERTSGLRERARAAAAAGAAGPMRSILDLIPTTGEQLRSLALARNIPLDDFGARLDRAAVAAGFRTGAFGRFAEDAEAMAGRIRAGKLLDVEHIGDPTVAELAGCLFSAPGPGRKDHGYLTHSRIALPAGHQTPELYRDLGRRLGIDGTNVRMTSHILMALELKDSVRDDVLLVTAVVLGVVLIMLWLSLRSALLVVLAMSPVVIGTAGMVLFMRAFALDFNFVNVLALPIMIGIGVDNALHLIIRARQDGGVYPAVTDTGRALVLCSLTTMWGFFSLFLPVLSPPHWGMRSLGLVVAVGMAGVLGVSLFFVPSALELLWRRRAPAGATASGAAPAGVAVEEEVSVERP